MIDIHCHFLPGIDDGPSAMEESVELARVAVADGITHSILTPHIHPGRWENHALGISHEVNNYVAELKKENIPLTISYAAEVRLTDTIFEQLKSSHIPFLGEAEGYSLMLLEFPHSHLIPGSEKLAEWLIKQGIRPVIAHPERNKSVMRNPSQLEPFLSVGCHLQVTAASLTGHFGSKAETIALKLLHENKITYVATDAHNLKNRPPVMSVAYNLVRELKGEDRAKELFYFNQLKFMGNKIAGNSHV